jgi:hypothetical protein
VLRPWRFENNPCCCQAIRGYNSFKNIRCRYPTRVSLCISQNPITHPCGFTVVEIGSCLHDSAPIPSSCPPTITVLCPLSLIGTLLVRLNQPLKVIFIVVSGPHSSGLLLLVNSKHFRDVASKHSAAPSTMDGGQMHCYLG